MNPHEHTHEIGIAAVKAAPPIAVSLASMAGFTISDLAYTVTIIYTLIMIGQHAWEKWIKPNVRRRKR
jgi:hypothetical protein